MAKAKKEEIGLQPDTTMNGRMFLGSLDDSVTRYPWTGAAADGRSLTATLIYHALLGPRLCSRVGNLLYHPDYLHAILERRTPLVGMCQSGFFQIHTKAEGFNESVEARLAEGTNSTRAFCAREGWSHGSAMHSRINTLQSEVTDRGRRRYKPEFHVAFQDFVDRLAPTAPDAFREVYKVWTDRYSGLARTRSNFEILCEQLYPGTGLDADKRYEAMSVINSANHYAYGVGMAALTPSTGEVPLVDTREQHALSSFTGSMLGSDDRRISTDRLIELAERRAFDVVQKNLVVPLNLFNSPDMWDRFTPMLDVERSTPASRQYQWLKLQVLVQIKRLLEASSVEAEKQQLRKLCKDFSKFIRSELDASQAPTTPITAAMNLEAVKRVPGALAETAASEGLSAVAGLLLPETVRKGAGWVANVVVSVVAPDAGNPIKRRLDKRWTGPKSSQRFYSEIVKPFRETLSVKQIDLEATRKAGLLL